VSRLAALEAKQFDVVIIGGGIVGCGIARDAALRGLRVALIEKNDFGSGTTSRSTRIVHGGLRYLQMLDFGLVRLDLRERETLLRIAPHLVKPLEFVVPFFEGQWLASLKMRVGLGLYDALSYDKDLPSRRWLSAAQSRRLDVALDRADIRGAAAYFDARVDSPERLALENVLDAEEHHASVLNYCEALQATVQGGRVTGVHVRDTIDGAEARVAARVVVNAAGAWLDGVAEKLTSRPAQAIRTTKGVHIVCPQLISRALVLFSRVDRRLLFAIPRSSLTWIGTTDTDYLGDPSDARATRADVQYLIESVGSIFPSLDFEDVLYTTAGVRALVRQPGAESSVSRMHRIIGSEQSAPAGMISVLGGKITGFRAIAETVTDAICSYLGIRNRKAVTADVPLPGARQAGSSTGGGNVPSGRASHLYDLYGTRAENVLALMRSDQSLARQLAPMYPDVAAQAVFAVRHEHCLRLSDFLWRRTVLGSTRDQGQAAATPAATLMGAALGWSADRIAVEIDSCRHHIDLSRSFKNDR
jgi:glycerol-3-phosphate dehydrogenase